MAHQGRTQSNKSHKGDLYWGRLSRDFRRAHYNNGGAYNPVQTTDAKPLTPTPLEMQYDKARIELEGPESKKWPGANWLAEDETYPYDGRSNRTPAKGGHNGSSFKGDSYAQRRN